MILEIGFDMFYKTCHELYLELRNQQWGSCTSGATLNSG